MSKHRKSPTSIPDGGLRVTSGGAGARGDPFSISWKYENEWGETVWLRPAGGIGMQLELGAPKSR
jgi:hypothetical protein